MSRAIHRYRRAARGGQNSVLIAGWLTCCVVVLAALVFREARKDERNRVRRESDESWARFERRMDAVDVEGRMGGRTWRERYGVNR